MTDTDLAASLRQIATWVVGSAPRDRLRAAADRLERLVAAAGVSALADVAQERDRLAEALRPFAELASAVNSNWPDEAGTSFAFVGENGKLELRRRVTLGDCRRAKAALEGKTDG
jgi:hypothetical protein